MRKTLLATAVLSTLGLFGLSGTALAHDSRPQVSFGFVVTDGPRYGGPRYGYPAYGYYDARAYRHHDHWRHERWRRDHWRGGRDDWDRGYDRRGGRGRDHWR